MLQSVFNKRKSKDKFAHTQLLGFDGKGSYPTFVGGCWSVVLTLFYYFTWYTSFLDMFYFDKSLVESTHSYTKPEEFGVLNVTQMESTPFYAVYYKGYQLRPKLGELCVETNGDCTELMEKYLVL